MDFIEVCLNEAKKAYKKGEVPIGAIIVKNGKIVSKAHNDREKSQNATHHAEILAINKACKKLKSWRLNECEMYVSLEPCIMCAGAILNSRLKTVYILCKDEEHGAVFKENLLQIEGLNHKTEAIFIHNEQAKNLLQTFFKSIRKNKKTS